MKQPILFTVFIILFLISGGKSIAQDDKEVKIKIMKDVDGEMKVFSKTYPSREAMANDPELKKFQEEMGDSTTFVIRTAKDGFTWNSDSSGKTMIVIDEDMQDGDSKMIFSDEHVIRLGDGNANAFFIRSSDADSAGGVFFLKDDSTARFSVKTIEGGHGWVMKDGPSSFNVRVMGGGKNMYINNASAEEIQSAGLAAGKELKPESIEYILNAAEGTLKLSFSTSSGDLSVRIVDENGKGIYSEEKNSFGGEYENEINLSGQEAGVYFLEIRQGSRAIIKKLTIE